MIWFFFSVVTTARVPKENESETTKASAVRRSRWDDGGRKERGKKKKGSEERGETFGKGMAVGTSST